MNGGGSGPSFTMAGFRYGVVRGGVLAPGVALYGVAFGVMSAAMGLHLAEANLFSALVFAGGAQMASLQVWAEPIPILALFFTALAMNTRYLLLGAALRPYLQGLPAVQAYTTMFFMGDGNWVQAMQHYQRGPVDAGFIVGSGALLWVVWVASTTAGYVGGQFMGRPEQFGIDFMVAAFFAAMAVAFVRNASALWPLLGGAITAIAVQHFLAGPWYIIAGSLVGSFIGAMRHVDPA